MIRWVLFLALATVFTTYTFWIYRRLELPVRGAGALAYVRALALVVMAALLLDPSVPDVAASDTGRRWALLDASLSMRASAPGGEAAWAEASARARALAEDGWRVVPFGAGLAGEGTPDEPAEAHTLLAEALERAVEGGARRIRVLTDGRFEDAVAVRAAAASLPVRLEVETYGSDVVNAGVSAFRVSDVPRPDQGPAAEVEVHASGAVDSLTIEIREEDTLVETARVEAPEAGLRRTVSLELPAARARGRVRYSASVQVPGDGFADDDGAVAYATVGHEEGALVVVSLQPDWEPRYLMPALGQATGLPTAGYLRVGPDRFLPMGRPLERGGPVDSATVGAAAADAALLVVHGIDSDADAWARRLVDRGGRRLLWVEDPEGAALADLSALRPDRGEWYASNDVPPSALAGDLAGLDLLGLPPLTDLLVLPEAGPAEVPLLVQLRGTGPGHAALHLRADVTGRRAVVLASGFWRWAARDGAAREAYRRLWSGVAGWLLGDVSATGPEVRPTTWVVERGRPVAWRVPGEGPDSVRLVVSRADTAVVDTVVARGSALSTGPHTPGSYTFRAEAQGGTPAGEGRFDVESRTAEMSYPVSDPLEASAASAGGAPARPTRPLRTSIWPYLLVILLLCGEWVGRRQIGLR